MIEQIENGKKDKEDVQSYEDKQFKFFEFDYFLSWKRSTFLVLMILLIINCLILAKFEQILLILGASIYAGCGIANYGQAKFNNDKIMIIISYFLIAGSIICIICSLLYA